MCLFPSVWKDPRLGRRAKVHPRASNPGLSETPCVKPPHPCFAGIMTRAELTIGPWQQLESLMATGKRIPLHARLSWKWKWFPYIRFSFFNPSGHILTSDLWQRQVSILANIPSPKSATHKGCYYKPNKHKLVISYFSYPYRCYFIGITFTVFEKHICIHNY